VTGLADHLAQRQVEEERLLEQHFQICDLDENGWLSLREAVATLALERDEYQRLDANRDGRMDAGEFKRERASLLARLGALPEPGLSSAVAEPPPEPDIAPAPPAARLDSAPLSVRRSEIEAMTVKPGVFLRRYDIDRSSGIDAAELAAAVAENGFALSPAQALEVLDRNDSGQLEASEVFALAWLASRAHPAPPPPQAEIPLEPTMDPAETPAQLGGSAPAPRPELRSHFARLDPGQDGFIDEADLRALQSPARLELRLRAVLSALDRDGDGRLSEDEFELSLGAVRRGSGPDSLADREAPPPQE
jgi:Ca2+-binding EF-hand superfamily protein